MPTLRVSRHRRRELDGSRSAGDGSTQRGHDRLELAPGAAAEERERDVELLPRDDATPGEMLLAPARQDLERLRGELQSEEESQASIAPDATRRGHTTSCRLCARTRRARCSDATVALERTVSRSAGSENSPPRLLSGVETWKYTSPTGFVSVPPPGPATPVTAIPTSTPSSSRTPSAIAPATSADTAPCAASSDSGTPS